MDPIFIIELLITSGGLLTIVMIAVIFKGKWRKRFLGVAAMYLVIVSMFFLARPYWIDFQQDRKVKYLEIYLKAKYSEETWKMEKVPHREEGFAHLNPYVISVYFDTEPGVIYEYYIKNGNEISQSGYGVEEGLIPEMIHLERE